MTALTATGTFSDNTTQNLTTACSGRPRTPAVATVSNGTGTEGQVTGVAAGTATSPPACWV